MKLDLLAGVFHRLKETKQTQPNKQNQPKNKTKKHKQPNKKKTQFVTLRSREKIVSFLFCNVSKCYDFLFLSWQAQSLMILSLQFPGMAELFFLSFQFCFKISWIELFPFVSFRPDFAACKANGAVSSRQHPTNNPASLGILPQQ